METRRFKLLLVDDNESFCELARTWLAPRYDLRVENSARAGLEALKLEPPDLILLDIMMPEVSGLDLFAALRDDTTLRHIPVLFLTAYHQVLSGDDEQLFNKSRVLLKPFRFEELQQQIDEILTGAKAGQA